MGDEVEKDFGGESWSLLKFFAAVASTIARTMPRRVCVVLRFLIVCPIAVSTPHVLKMDLLS